MNRTSNSTLLFVTLSAGLFLLLNLTFPPAAGVVLGKPMDGALNGLAAGQLSGVVFLFAEIAILILLSLVFSWCFGRLAEMTDSATACRLVLVAGALFTAGHLIIMLWSGFDTGSQNMLSQRVVLSAWVVAVCGSAVNALVRFGPEPDSRFGTAGYSA